MVEEAWQLKLKFEKGNNLRAESDIFEEGSMYSPTTVYGDPVDKVFSPGPFSADTDYMPEDDFKFNETRASIKALSTELEELLQLEPTLEPAARINPFPNSIIKRKSTPSIYESSRRKSVHQISGPDSRSNNKTNPKMPEIRERRESLKQQIQITELDRNSTNKYENINYDLNEFKAPREKKSVWSFLNRK